MKLSRRRFLKTGVAGLVAAPSIAKGGIHGSFKATPPGAATAFGYTKLAFFDDFNSISTIDVNDTGALGFKWYVHNTWPNVADVNPASPWKTASPTPASAISVANSILTISQDPNGLGYCVSTICYNASSGYIGQAFSNGAYFEASMLCATVSSGGPVFWTTALQFLNGTAFKFAEMDFVQMYQGGNQRGALVWWDASVDPALNQFHTVGPLPPSFDFQYHKFGLLWVPMAKNGGTGLMNFYFDGVLFNTNTYTTSGPPTPWGIADTQSFPLVFGTADGPTVSMSIDWVSVWQNP